LPGHDADLRDARTRIARLPAWGRAWRIEALAAAHASGEARTRAVQAARAHLARLDATLAPAQRATLQQAAAALGIEDSAP
jgi:hypothetical protein